MLQPGSPAVRPDVPQGGHDPVGDDGATVLWHPMQDVEADRPLKVGRVEIDQLVGAPAGDEGKGSLGQVAVRVKEGNAAIHGEVLAQEIENYSGLAGTGLPDDVEMSAAVIVGDAE